MARRTRTRGRGPWREQLWTKSPSDHHLTYLLLAVHQEDGLNQLYCLYQAYIAKLLSTIPLLKAKTPLLLSLPRELRDRVYAFALVSDSPFWWPGKLPESGLSDRDKVGVGLLRTSSQVYRECVDILYSQNKFVFTHPSDCNMFRVVASPASVNITSVYFRIRQKDLKLWTTYLGSKQPERSLKSDLPKLKSLWVFLRCGAMVLPAAFGTLPAGPAGPAPRS